MEELYEYRRGMLVRFVAVVDDLLEAAGSFPAEQVHTPLQPGGWSLHQVLVHLRDDEAHAFLPRFERILSEERPYLENFDDQAWMKMHYDPAEPVGAILSEYRRLRLQELALLESMPVEGWSRVGRHPGRGLRSLQWWVEYSLAHAEEHLEQIRQYAGATAD